MKHKLSYLLILATLLIVIMPLSLAMTESFGKYNQYQTVNLIQTYNSSYCNITSITSPNSTIYPQAGMTKSGMSFNYTFKNTELLGNYQVCGDCGGKAWCADLEIKSTSLVFIILLYSFAFLFFFATLIVDEEFFVYISGILFLIGGIYLMINGLEDINNLYSRAISYVSIGIGLLFTIGAYVFNSYRGRVEEEIE